MGLLAIVFVCPACGTVDRWGTAESVRGHCRGYFADGTRCTFEWRRCHDWAVFRRANRRKFRTREEYDACLRTCAQRTEALN